jgi:hypothetical protein
MTYLAHSKDNGIISLLRFMETEIFLFPAQLHTSWQNSHRHYFSGISAIDLSNLRSKAVAVLHMRLNMGKRFLVRPLNGDDTYHTNYEKYIRSFHWRIRADWLKKHAGHKCQECGLPDGMFVNRQQVFLNVHHKHYRTLGREQPRDVQVLCNPCHKKKHRRWR